MDTDHCSIIDFPETAVASNSSTIQGIEQVVTALIDFPSHDPGRQTAETYTRFCALFQHRNTCAAPKGSPKRCGYPSSYPKRQELPEALYDFLYDFGFLGLLVVPGLFLKASHLKGSHIV